MSERKSETIYCIGDSHASFFSGRNSIQPAWPERSEDIIPSFKSYRLGATLAYSLSQSGTRTQGREKLLEITSQLPKNSYVLLNFGEIDCRVHLLKQAQEQSKNKEEVVSECVQRYFSVIKELQEKFRVIVWAVVPSTSSEKSIDPRYPHFGSNLERNEVTSLFNKQLERLCRDNQILFISLFSQLINKNGSTNTRYFWDGVHLSQNAMPLAIEEILKNIPTFSFKLFSGILGTVPFPVQKTLLKFKSEIVTTLYFLYKNARTKARILLKGK